MSITILTGSHLYGVSTKQSDYDYKSVVMPTASEILLGKACSLRMTSPEGKNRPGDADHSVYSFQYFLNNVQHDWALLEMLHAPKECMAEHSEPDMFLENEWQQLRASRHMFFTKGHFTILRGAISMVNMVIHRSYMIDELHQLIKFINAFNDTATIESVKQTLDTNIVDKSHYIDYTTDVNGVVLLKVAYKKYALSTELRVLKRVALKKINDMENSKVFSAKQAYNTVRLIMQLNALVDTDGKEMYPLLAEQKNMLLELKNNFNEEILVKAAKYVEDLLPNLVQAETTARDEDTQYTDNIVYDVHRQVVADDF